MVERHLLITGLANDYRRDTRVILLLPLLQTNVVPPSNGVPHGHSAGLVRPNDVGGATSLVKHNDSGCMKVQARMSVSNPRNHFNVGSGGVEQRIRSKNAAAVLGIREQTQSMLMALYAKKRR